jgi:hypothetical protein
MKTRLRIPRTVEKRVFQEAGSRCPFCSETEIASLEIHHIDTDPANNRFENLLLVCATCHSKITAGIISEADVQRTKLHFKTPLQSIRRSPEPSVAVSISHSQFRGDIAHTINKIVAPRPLRIRHPEGSLGADLKKKGYIDYLITQYFTFRKADVSYGKGRAFSYAELHTTIQRKFGHKTFFMPVELFPSLVKFLQHRIDQTILGKHNRSEGKTNYHSYAEHVEEHEQNNEGDA